MRKKLLSVLLLVTRKEVFRVVLAAVFLACMLAATVYKGGDYSKLFSLTMFSTILIEAMIVATVSLLRLLLLSHTEDPSKLTDNYSGLIKRYSSEDRFVWKRNGDKEAEAIPVVLEEWLYDKEIRIVDDPDHRYFLPNEIIEHYQELFDAHKTSKIYNSTNIRINDWEYARYKDDTTSEMKMAFTICTGRTTYYSSLVTNRAMDYPLSKGLSARELLEPGPFLHPLKYSSLSNHIGFNGFVISADNNVMFVQRRKDLSIGKRTWGDSIEASLKAKYAFNVNGDYKFTLDGLKKGIELEIVDELGIPRDSLCSPDLMHCNDVLNPICLIAAYRDLLEGGKPQFLFYTRTSLNKDQINTQFNEMIRAKSSQNGTDHIKNENVTKTDGDHLCWVSLDELKQAIVKANGIDVKVIADKADSKKNNGIEHLEMFPSASACVAMLIRYLNYLEDKKQLLPYGMKVRNTEVYKKAKGIKCGEDDIYDGDRFIALIHGEKSSGNHPYPGNAPEKLATKVVKRAFESLEKNIKKEMSSEEKILAFLEKALAKEMEAEAKKQQCELEPADYLRASVIYFDREMKTVVSYGNCNCRIGSNSIMHDENTKKLGDNGYKPQDGENIEEKTAKDKTKKETIKNHKSVIVYEGQKVILWTDDFPIRNEAAVIEANSYEGTYVEIW